MYICNIYSQYLKVEGLTLEMEMGCSFYKLYSPRELLKGLVSNEILLC